MGFFTGLGKAAREAGDAGRLLAGAARGGADLNALRDLGFSKVPGDATYNRKQGTNYKGTEDAVLLNQGKGYAQQYLENAYDLNTDNARNVVAIARDYANDKGKARGSGERIFGTGQWKEMADEYVPQKGGNKFADANHKVTFRKAGDAMQPQSMSDRVKLGDKDMRSVLAEEKLRVANDMAGGGYTRDQLVDMVNDVYFKGADRPLTEKFAMDRRVQDIYSAGEAGKFNRPAFENDRFIGEGQFGRVSEFAPGYVIKEQAPLVMWGGPRSVSTDGSWSEKGMIRGKLHDYRDVAGEVDQLNTLAEINIAPKVESFDVNSDGSTEIVMRDLRDNYQLGADYKAELQRKYDQGSPSEKAQVLKDSRLFEVKRRQQEAMANMKGLDMGDRHDGNVMIHKMMGRPLQIDPSARPISGVDKDLSMAQKAVEGMRGAGAIEEADIFVGLVNEAQDRGDMDAVHDLAQQGVSRLLKIKKVADVPTAAEASEWRIQGNLGLPVMNESAFA